MESKKYATFTIRLAAILDLAEKDDLEGSKNLNPMIFLVFVP